MHSRIHFLPHSRSNTRQSCSPNSHDALSWSRPHFSLSLITHHRPPMPPSPIITNLPRPPVPHDMPEARSPGLPREQASGSAPPEPAGFSHCQAVLQRMPGCLCTRTSSQNRFECQAFLVRDDSYHLIDSSSAQSQRGAQTEQTPQVIQWCSSEGRTPEYPLLRIHKCKNNKKKSISIHFIRLFT